MKDSQRKAMFAKKNGISVISDVEAKKLSKKLFNKSGISNEDYEKLVEHKKSKASDLYKSYIGKYPNSQIAREYRKGSLGHGNFGEKLFAGDYQGAMYRADGDNLVKLKDIGIEHHLSKKQNHPDDPSDYDEFQSRYEWANNRR